MNVQRRTETIISISKADLIRFIKQENPTDLGITSIDKDTLVALMQPDGSAIQAVQLRITRN